MGISVFPVGGDAADEMLRSADRAMYRAKAEGMIVGLAGSLGKAGLRRVATIPGDVVGVRGAACAGDRSGVVAEERVRSLKTALQEAAPPATATPQAAAIWSM